MTKEIIGHFFDLLKFSMIVSLVEEDTEKMNKQRINNHVYSFSLFVSSRHAIMLNFNISKVAYCGLG